MLFRFVFWVQNYNIFCTLTIGFEEYFCELKGVNKFKWCWRRTMRTMRTISFFLINHIFSLFNFYIIYIYNIKIKILLFL